MEDRIKIAIVFDTKEDYGIDAEDLDYCDFSYLSDVERIKDQLEYEGYEIMLINPPTELLQIIKNNKVKRPFDIIFNMSEGFNSRNREILIPIICETYRIPYIGTDAFGLSFTNHKFQTKLFAEHWGISTPNYFYFDHKIHSYQSIKQNFKNHISCFPAIVKPNREGSSMGLRKVFNTKQLIESAKELTDLYNQELIVEKYIKGPDILSFIIGTENDAKVCPLVEVTNINGGNLDLWDTEKKIINAKYVNARIPLKTIKIIKEQSLLLHKVLHLYDISRIDWKVNEQGVPFFLESTPLPSLGRDFDCSAKSMGLTFHQLLGIVINLAIKRLIILGLFPEH